MRTVRDEAGNRYVLVKRSSESSRVRDPATGEERHVANDELSVVEGESPFETAARAVSEPVRRILTATHDERALGLLVELATHGPRSARELLAADDRCESTLHGVLIELRAAGLVEPTTVDGEPGYEVSAETVAAVEALTSV